MKFTHLSLFQFKNYIQREFTFSKKLICITGKNGCGKTTILDALHFLSFTKSYFLHQDQLSVTKDRSGMRIAGKVLMHDEEYVISCVLREHGKKELQLNGVLYQRFSEHIGRFPCIFVCPDDTQLIMEGAEVRRRFLDMACSMIYPEYLSALSVYNKILVQRNSLLKNWMNQSEQVELLSVYDQQLDGQSKPIYTIRHKVCDELSGYTKELYRSISESSDDVALTYNSTLHKSALLDSLSKNRMKDILSQRSNYGIHKDDWYFEINTMPMKQAASQGQKKSFVFGLKLALFHLTKKELHTSPVLLLDDFFEKLDQDRAKRLIDYVYSLNTQVFFTDTHVHRVAESFTQYSDELQVINLDTD